MCLICNYKEMLEQTGLEATPNRLAVLEAVGDSPYPLRAQEILDTLSLTRDINRVTVYRILDLLVAGGLLDRLSSGDRSFRYGLAPNDNHLSHPHFYCTRCGQMQCLKPDDLSINLQGFEQAFSGRIERMEIRFDGTCSQCLIQVRRGL